ncbi:MAG: aromatic amino acid lyase, partial [bacterium]|nr:aromatic amino acid lyase [bacterium]
MTDRLSENANCVQVGIGDAPLELSAFDAWYGCRLEVSIDASAIQRLERSRAIVEKLARADEPVYGVNTGFGSLCNQRIGAADLELLQENLILSHAVGVGPPVPAELVRLMLLLKVQGLCLGASGVKTATVAGLVGLLNADILPVIPTQGSLGASGDLAPLA